jgi:hypothetical protein
MLKEVVLNWGWRGQETPDTPDEPDVLDGGDVVEGVCRVSRVVAKVLIY